ncbi:MAG: pyridoxamine 5'-phosphate oxidase family protein, partial [Thermoleophilia bacterium]|nr:pyridoxamine 5'-phosphate oxidase family protein [Thermoleophilia bacterium]
MDERDPMALLRQWQNEARLGGETAPDEVVLSTVSAAGDPSARMVSAKAITSDGIVFGTRLGTRKVADLAANPRCAFTFWWPSLDRSVRVACTASALD